MNDFCLFFFFCKIIGHILCACRYCPQSERSNQQKSKQYYIFLSPTWETREKSVKLHTEMVNVVNIAASNDCKPFYLGGNVIAPNNEVDQEDSLEGMSSFVDDS